MPMTKLATLSLCLGLALVVARPAAAQGTQAATTQDIQRLQYDLQNLDDSLTALSTSHPRYQEFQDRANDIRDEVTYLKVQIRRGQRSKPPGLGATRSEVEDLRQSIASLQSDIDNALNRRFSGSATLPEGTENIDLGGDNAKRAGIGAVLGGVIGQVIGGTKGAIIGAVLGGGGALAAKLGEDVDLPAGTILTLRLERALDVTR